MLLMQDDGLVDIRVNTTDERFAIASSGEEKLHRDALFLAPPDCTSHKLPNQCGLQLLYHCPDIYSFQEVCL